MIVLPYTEGLVYEMDFNDVVPNTSKKVIEDSILVATHAGVIMDKDKPIIVFLSNVIGSVSFVSALMVKGIEDRALKIVKLIKRISKEYMVKQNIYILAADDVTNNEQVRWLKILGFKKHTDKVYIKEV